MSDHFNDDEYEGIQSVKIAANRNKGKKMVNGVSMATIYDGMSLHRYHTLTHLEQTAWDNTFVTLGSAKFHTDEFDAAQDTEFQRLCRIAARKAGWHAAKRASQKNHPVNSKKKGK
jgi:L-asparaginase/Glu-tRNA(Gln) amidotransferase subunit D